MNARRALPVPLLAAVIITVAAADLRADEGWSSSAHLGLTFLQERGASVSSGGWFELLHSIAPNASAGVEAGYMTVAGAPPTIVAPGSQSAYLSLEDKSYNSFSASGAFRVRGGGSLRPYVLGTFGYYDVSTRIHILGVDQVEDVWSPGFSFGVGVSGSELVRPGFQLRWHETLGPEHTNVDIVTFEVGLHYN